MGVGACVWPTSSHCKLSWNEFVFLPLGLTKRSSGARTSSCKISSWNRLRSSSWIRCCILRSEFSVSCTFHVIERTSQTNFLLKGESFYELVGFKCIYSILNQLASNVYTVLYSYTSILSISALLFSSSCCSKYVTLRNLSIYSYSIIANRSKWNRQGRDNTPQ